MSSISSFIKATLSRVGGIWDGLQENKLSPAMFYAIEMPKS